MNSTAAASAITHTVSPDGLEPTSTAIWSDGHTLSSTSIWATPPEAFAAHDAAVMAFAERLVEQAPAVLPRRAMSVRTQYTRFGLLGFGSIPGGPVHLLPRVQFARGVVVGSWLGRAFTLVRP